MSTVLDDVALESPGELSSLLAGSFSAEPETPIVLSLDIGTSGVRAMLFDGRGDEIAGSHVTLSSNLYPALRAGIDTDADALVELFTHAIDILAARLSESVSRIDYVATSCFWHSLIGVDEAGRASTAMFGWADTRAGEFADQLRSELDESATHTRTGCRFHPSYWPAKLRWLKTKHRESFSKSNLWLSFPDYLALKLFGDPKTSVSMASATGLFNQRECAWDEPLIEHLGIGTSSLPAIAPSAFTFQELRSEYATRWPLLDRAVWFPAIGDGAANNIGAGGVTRDYAVLMIGTSGAMRVVFEGDPPNPLSSALFCYRFDRRRVVIGGALSDGGGLYQWMKDALELNYDNDDLEGQISAIMPDTHGLTVMPFWSGERAPGWSTSAHGAIYGLSAETKPIEILRAVMEAIGYRFALLARALDAIAPRATIIGAGNALLSSPVWTQIIADALGRTIKLSGAGEASCRGAALLVLEAVGKIDAIEKLQPEFGDVYEPSQRNHACYAKAIERQQELYGRMISHGDTETQSQQGKTEK